MKFIVAIHGQNGFAQRWPESVRRLGGEVRHVSGYDPNLFDQLEGCDAFLWHINQDSQRDLDYARSILASVEEMGIKVYPNHSTSWHFDDKVAQKYRLQAAGAPIAPTWLFFDKQDAYRFLETAEFPLVFKLRRGAGSLNVRLIRTKAEGQRAVRKMFGVGLRAQSPSKLVTRAFDRANKTGEAPGPFVDRAQRAGRRFIEKTLYPVRERGYVLFQQFLPGNDHDIRIVTIGSRAFCIKRDVRADDFRVGDSSRLSYPGHDAIPMDVVEIALSLSRRFGFQSMGYDFIRNVTTGDPKILEFGYAFPVRYVLNCPGYIDESMRWVSGSVRPEDLIVEDLFNKDEATRSV